MNLHEYQAKQILIDYGLLKSRGGVVSSVDEAIALFEIFPGKQAVVKAQVHAGGRGKAGGVKFVTNKADLEKVCHDLLGKRLVTYQTDERGQPVNQLLLEQPVDIARELYLGAVVDRVTQCVVFMASTEGGVEIEEVAANHPEKILQIVVDPLVGILPYQCREVAFKLNLNAEQIKQFTQLVMGLYKMFIDTDCSLLEINPLVITNEGNLLCLDCKLNIDDNALYRLPKIRALRDTTQEDERENRARDWELNYIALDGDIGCMVNGAGLAMATMDIIKLYGGNPANFLDVGGGATKERVTEAFKIILSDSNVKAILVNIFGGIVRCDLIADGIMGAVKEADIKVPVVVRLEGNNAELGSKMLEQSGLNIIAANSLADAAQKVVNVVREMA